MTTQMHVPEEYPPGLVLRATLALDFMAFTEFAFGVVRPNTLFKPNWHLEALAHKLSQVAAGEVRRLIVTIPPRNLKSLFASVATVGTRGHGLLFGSAGAHSRQRFPPPGE